MGRGSDEEETGMKTGMAAAALAMMAGFAAAQDGDADRKIEALIRQLGAEEYAAREKATEELRKIGKPAEEALRRAAESDDAEVQSRARALLKDLEKPAAPEKPRAGAAPRRAPGFNFQGFRGGSLSVQSTNGDSVYKVSPSDGSEPFTLHRGADGSVRLEYGDGQGGTKTAEAESMEGFLKEHKELAEKYGISRNGIDYGGLRAGFGREAFRIQPGFQFRLEDLIPPGGEDEVPRRAGRAGGASFEIPSDTVRSQLGLAEGEGVVVTAVPAGSDAEAAGLLRHDILLEIGGRKVASVRDAREGLQGASSVTVLRKGKRQTLTPRPEGKKSDF
jgi:hypothetical protein